MVQGMGKVDTLSRNVYEPDGDESGSLFYLLIHT